MSKYSAVRKKYLSMLNVIKYGVVGAISTLIHISVASLYIYFISSSIVESNVVGFLIAYVFSYFAQSVLVFESGVSIKKALKYFSVQAVALMLAIFISNYVVFYNKYIQIITVAMILPLITFFIHKFWTFKADEVNYADNKLVDNISKYYLLMPLIIIGLYSSIFAIIPFYGEDFGLSKLFNNEGAIQRLLWAIDRAIYQASNWNARLGELNAIIQLSLPKVLFIISSFASLILLNSIISVSLFKSHFTSKFFISLGALFVFWPGMEVFFWKTVNAGYLQPMLLSFPCLYFYNRRDTLEQLNRNTFLLAVSSVLLFMLGFSFENVAPALVIYALFSMWLYKKIGLVKLYIPLVFMISGWWMLMSMPSTAYRSNFYKEMFSSDYSNYEYVLSRVIDVVLVFFQSTFSLFLAALIASLYLFRVRGKTIELLLPLIPIVLVVGSIILSPYTEPRSFLLAWVIMFCYVVEGLHAFFMQNKNYGTYVILALYVSSFYILIKAYNIYDEFSYQANNRHHEIILNIEKGCNIPTNVNEIINKENYTYKYINNRDEWYLGNLDQISRFYGCTVTTHH